MSCRKLKRLAILSGAVAGFGLFVGPVAEGKIVVWTRPEKRDVSARNANPQPQAPASTPASKSAPAPAEADIPSLPGALRIFSIPTGLSTLTGFNVPDPDTLAPAPVSLGFEGPPLSDFVSDSTYFGPNALGL